MTTFFNDVRWNMLKNLKWTNYTNICETLHIDCLGDVAQSAKMAHSYIYKVSTYCIYLASANLSGFDVCSRKYSKNCRENCLMGSGRNRVMRMSSNEEASHFIDNSRILKTLLFFANREVFMRLMIHEINRERAKAEKLGHEFSIRINGTSDLSPVAFRIDGKNILELFPDVQFYDYTKVPERINSTIKNYSNYDITWSIDGSEENLKKGLQYLKHGGRVAVVFGTNTLPKMWHGYKVVDGDAYDFRYKDGNVVVGLKFKKTANNYINGQFVMPNTSFIVMENDINCVW